MHSPWIKTLRNAWLLAAAGFVVACGGSDVGDEELGTSQLALAPGSNAAFVSSTIPTTMAPGERLNVQVVMQNTGSAVDGTNTWTPSGYSLYRTNNLWSWVNTPVPVSTPVGSTATFNFIITAPATPGTYAFGARMRQDLLFGETASVPSIVVSNATTPRWSCAYEPGSSNVPTTLAPGQTQLITVVVRNTGTATWQTANTYLRSQDTPASLWGQTVTALPTSVAPGATATFSLSIKAPTAPGNYNLRRQMQNGEVGEFLATPCVDVPITVGGNNPLNSSLVTQDFPSLMAPGEARLVNVTLSNSGAQTWAADGSFRLASKNSPASLWGATLSDVTTATAAGGSFTFTFSIVAPTAPGAYRHRWQMRKLTGTDAGDFGTLLDLPVTVDAAATPQYTATVGSQSIPARVTAGKAATFTIRMTNNGTTAWTGSNFGLYSNNSPTSLWGLSASSLGSAESVAAGASRDFVLHLTAPATPGNYDSRWRMRQIGAGSVGFFGDEAVTLGIEVTLCGNGVVDAGEACDDGNLADGDSCSSICQSTVPRIVDLATDTANRTLIGVGTNKALANVAIGDFSGDGTRDVITGENANVSPTGQAFRNQAGLLRGYSGTNFFSGGAASLTVYGARANDSLGALGGGLLVGDVTGDGVADVVASAGGADGPSNGRADCGSVYVLRGGAALTGLVDLGATTPHASFVAEVYGPATNVELRLLALGDVSGDGVSDLILGGVDRVYIVPGGASLTGKIDLATPPAGVSTISGSGIGRSAAVGDFGGSSSMDLVVGSSNYSHGALSESGAAWGVFGPITANRDLSLSVGSASGANVAWFGQGTNDHFGISLRVGNVLGSSYADVIVGANQQRKAGAQVGAVNVWAGGIANGTTFDLSTGNVPTLTVLGADQFDTAGAATGLGDWNGDGVLDLAIAASAGDGPANDRDGAGELKLVLGSPSLAGTIDLLAYQPILTIYGAGSRDLLGSFDNTVAIDDIDGDGKADLCVGSRKGGTNATLTAPGRVDCVK